MAWIGPDGLQFAYLVGLVEPAEREGDQRPVRSLNNLIEVVAIGPCAHHHLITLRGHVRLRVTEVDWWYEQFANPPRSPCSAMRRRPCLRLILVHCAHTIALRQLG